MATSSMDPPSAGKYLISVEKVLYRIERAKERPSKGRNCVGTALYIIGAQGKEVFVPPYMGLGFRGLLEPSPSRDYTAVLACQLSSDLSVLVHMLVAHPDRCSVVHRAGYEGEIRVDPWEDALDSWLNGEGSFFDGKVILSEYRLKGRFGMVSP